MVVVRVVVVRVLCVVDRDGMLMVLRCVKTLARKLVEIVIVVAVVIEVVVNLERKPGWEGCV